MAPQNLLKYYLRFAAFIELLALPTMFLPWAWMNATHQWLGLGDLPNTPMISYLTRALAGMYAFHGAITWFISNDVERYRSFIRFLGWATLLFGGVLLGIDLSSELPWYWSWVEGPSLMASGLIIILLERSSR
jgi:hypothetical protein